MGTGARKDQGLGEFPELPHCHHVSQTRSCRNSSELATHTRTQTYTHRHTPHPTPEKRLFLLPRGLGEVSTEVTLVVTLFYSSQTGIGKTSPLQAPSPGKVDVSPQAPHPSRLVLTSAYCVVLAGLSER